MSDNVIPLRGQPVTIEANPASLGRAAIAGSPLPQQQQTPSSGVEIEAEDGTRIIVTDDPEEISAPYIKEAPDEDESFGENLALRMHATDMASLGDEILQGIDTDEMSRTAMISDYADGIDLLGLIRQQTGTAAQAASASRGTRRNISQIGHPLMIEAVVKYWAGASAELLPASGPAKVPTIGSVTKQDELMAQAFEADFNYLLTDVHTEYYDDTSRALVQAGYCGNVFKKIFWCPIRGRPVSESVILPNLIVSEQATDLENAVRVTHRIEMSRAELRRMQIFGGYRDVDLGLPQQMFGFSDQAQREIRRSEGLIRNMTRPQDQPYIIFESDTDVDVDRFDLPGHFEREAPEGLPLPYKIAVDRATRQVLGVWRNWRPTDDRYRKRNMYVRYGLAKGLGYHDWGFLRLLGNQTQALRGAWRLLLDAGMFSIFPGGVQVGNQRTGTNEIAPGPGEFVHLDMPGGVKSIQDMIMPLPYKDISGTFVQFCEMVAQDAMRLGGTVELEVGEGRTNVPVGTMMGMIEQQTQVMAAVHRGNHRSQREEFRKIRELYAENPQALTKLVRDNPRRPPGAKLWELGEEFSNLNLLPASDPNVPASVHRLMRANVLVLLAQQAPQLFDQMEVLRRVLRTLNEPDIDTLLAPQQQPGAPPPPPDLKGEAALISAQAKQQQVEADAAHDAQTAQLERETLAADTAKTAAQNETMLNIERIMANTSGGIGFGAQGQPRVIGFGNEGAPPVIP